MRQLGAICELKRHARARWTAEWHTFHAYPANRMSIGRTRSNAAFFMRINPRGMPTDGGDRFNATTVASVNRPATANLFLVSAWSYLEAAPRETT